MKTASGPSRESWICLPRAWTHKAGDGYYTVNGSYQPVGRSGKVWMTSEVKEELKKDGGGNKKLTCIGLPNKQPPRIIKSQIQ